MSYEIRAMGFSEILDAAFRLLRDRFVVLVGIGAIVYVPLSVINAVMVAPAAGSPIGSSFLLGLTLTLIIALVGLPLAQLALTHAVSEIYLGGQLGIGRAYSRGLTVYLPYIGTVLLAGIGLVLGFLCFILPGIYLAVLWMLVGPIAVVEDTYGTRALARSRDLMRGSWWRGLGIVIAAGLIFGVVSAGVNFVFAFVPVIGPLVDALVQSMALVFNLAVLVLLYFDLRCRHEDFDLRYLSSQVGSDSAQGLTADGE